MRLRPALALLLLLLAGCSDADGSDGDLDALQATAETGVLRGVVVDAAVAPVEGAVVTLLGGNGTASDTTDAEGRFGFDGLEPGVHRLRVERDGFLEAETTATVVAGEAEPEAVRVELARDPDKTPFVESSGWDGFIQCSLRAQTVVLGEAGVAVCSAAEPNVSLDDDVFHELAFGGAPDWVQTDMEWESSQPLGQEMSLRYGPAGCENTHWSGADGPSPVTVSLGTAVLRDKGIGAGNGFCVRVFTWVSEAAMDLVGAQVQQPFSTYTHAFYNLRPDEGWSFVKDGPYPVPGP